MLVSELMCMFLFVCSVCWCAREFVWYVWMGMYKCIYMYVCNCMYIMCIRVYVYVCGVCVCMGCICIIVRVWVHVFGCMRDFGHVRAIWTRYEIQSCTHYGPDTQAIQKSTYEMIRKFVPVRATDTRRRFASETASFHVSVCFHVIFLFTVVNAYLCFIHIISCDHLIYYTNMFTWINSWDISEH